MGQHHTLDIELNNKVTIAKELELQIYLHALCVLACVRGLCPVIGTHMAEQFLEVFVTNRSAVMSLHGRPEP
jgi:hypothetical protein